MLFYCLSSFCKFLQSRLLDEEFWKEFDDKYHKCDDVTEPSNIEENTRDSHGNETTKKHVELFEEVCILPKRGYT